MENPFARKLPKRNRRKKKQLSSSQTNKKSLSSSSSVDSSLLSKNASNENSETYEEPWKKDQKNVITQSLSEDAIEDGYESDHVPSLPQRCALSLNLNFHPDRLRRSRKLLFHSENSQMHNLPKTAPSSPESESESGDGIPFLPTPSPQSASTSAYSYTPSSSASSSSKSPSSYRHYHHDTNNIHQFDKISPSSLPPSAVSGLKYSLRSMIGDGTHQPNGPTIMQRRSLKPNQVHINLSHWSCHGLRPYMEDRYIVEGLSEHQTCVGVFDGHGGQEASQFCCDHFYHYFQYSQLHLGNHTGEENTIPTSFHQTFQNMDRDIVRSGYTDGTTACVCLIENYSKIYCANAGDSRAIVIRRDGSVACLSRDHKPGVPDESQRITELGGRIVYFGRWRVEGVLAVSRSLGDSALKPYISAEPEVCEYTIGMLCYHDCVLLI